MNKAKVPVVSDMFRRVGFRIFSVHAASFLFFAACSVSADETAHFTVDVKLDESSARALEVTLDCRQGSSVNVSADVPPGESKTFSIPVRENREVACKLGARPLPGQQLSFLGDGGSKVDLLEDGCLFSGVMPGHSNFCQIQIQNQTTSLTVYKKWIGAQSEEADVQILLACKQDFQNEPRLINADVPGEWVINTSDPDGILCDVYEVERRDFIADISDCQDLLIRPGTREECTMVNTKVVKMIQMLNRYGLVVMIMLFLAAGLYAANRMVR